MIVLSIGATAWWLVGTEGGAQWLLARSEPYLPDALTIGSVSGSVMGGLEVSRLRWHDDAVDVQIETLAVRAQLLPLTAGKLLVSSLEVRGVLVDVFESSSSAPDKEPLVVDLPLDIAVDAATLAKIRFRIRDTDRRIDSLTFAGSLAGTTLSLDHFELRSEWLVIEATTALTLQPPYESRLSASWQLPDLLDSPMSGELRLYGDTNGYRLEHHLVAPAAIDTEATVAFPGGELFVDSSSEWNAWDLALADGRTVETRNGRLTLRGSLEEYSLAGDVNMALAEFPAADIGIVGAGTIDGLAIETLQLRSSAGGLDIAGDIDWGDGIRWDLVFALAGFSPSVVVATLSGEIDANGSSAGQWSADRPIEVDLEVERIAGTLNDYPLTGTLAAGLLGDVLSVSTGQLAVQGNRLNFSGTFNTSPGERFDLSLNWSAPALDVFYDAAAGSSIGRLQAAGSLNRWTIDTDASGNDIRWGELRAGSVEVRGAFGSDRAGQLTFGATDLSSGERNIESLSVTLAGAPAAHTVSSRLIAYGMTAEAQLSGELTDDAWRGRVDSLRAEGDLLGQWVETEAAELQFGRAGLQLDRLCLTDANSGGTACVALSSRPESGLGVDASIAGLPLAALPLGLPAAIAVAGQLQADARITVRDNVLNGDLTSTLIGASLSTTYEGDVVTVAASEAELQATLAENKLTALLSLVLDDSIGRLDFDLEVADASAGDSPLDGEVRIALNDLSFAQLIVTAVSDVDGRLNGSLQVGGRMSTLDYRGSLRLEEGAFAVPAAGIEVTDTTLTLSQSPGGRLQLDGSASSGDGRVTVSGFTELSNERELRAELSIDGENFQIARLPNWQATASPSVRVEVDSELTQVSGEIVIPSANLVFNELPATANVPSDDAIIHGRDDPRGNNGRRRTIDLQATLGDDVKLAGFGLTTGMSGTVRLRGGTRSPITGLGRIDLYDGRYKAYGQELEIERGALTFNGPLENPVLDVQAERRINGDIVAGITLAGTPRSPQSSLYSEPAMSDAEVLSYLLTGRPLNSASEGEGAILGQAAFALGLSGAGAIATQVGNTLGLDTLAVDGNADTGRIVAGKRLGNRLLVEYGYGLVDKLGTLLLRYELNDRVIIESSTGSSSTLDVVYSIKKE